MYACTLEKTTTQMQYNVIANPSQGFIQDFWLGGGGNVFSHASIKQRVWGHPPRKFSFSEVDFSQFCYVYIIIIIIYSYA